MKKLVLICPDSFKESLSARQAGDAIAAGFREAPGDWLPEVYPMADGGEGTLDTVLESTGGEKIFIDTRDPLLRPISAPAGILPDGRVLLETAAVIGLPLLAPEERDPARTSTIGVGILLRELIKRGHRDFLLTLGGSSTSDGGAGILQALGFSLLDSDGLSLPPGGAALERLECILPPEDGPPLGQVRFTLLCDVENPLCGEQGAAKIYGPQKGAGPELAEQLDRALCRYGSLVEKVSGRSVLPEPGLGAAGGLGVPLHAFASARRESGARFVMELTGLTPRIPEAHLVVTGEGRLDGQSASGKVAGTVAAECRRHGVPCVALCGSLRADHTELYAHGLTAAFACIDRPAPLEELRPRTAENLRSLARNAARLWDSKIKGG